MGNGVRIENEPEQSADEAIRVVAKYNWQDLREESFEERDSSVYRKAVRNLAAELARRADLARTVGDLPASPVEANSAVITETSEAPGILDSFVTTEEALPRAGTLLQEIGQQMESINLMMEKFSEKVEAASARGQGMKAALTLTNRLAQELSDPADQIANAGREYGQVLAELDTAVHIQIDMIEAQEKLSADHEEYLGQIVGLLAAAREAQPGFESVLSGAEEASTFSRSLRAPLPL